LCATNRSIGSREPSFGCSSSQPLPLIAQETATEIEARGDYLPASLAEHSKTAALMHEAKEGVLVARDCGKDFV